MAYSLDKQYEHLLRRAGFGARPDELAKFRTLSFRQAIEYLIQYERVPDDVDNKIDAIGYIGIARTGGVFSPRSVITDARQRWLFRMVHTNRPLQEKMTLFWHNHFATGFTKNAGTLNSQAEATRYMASKASEDPGRVRGQLEMLRDNALGNFEEILTLISKDTAMLLWLDGYSNTNQKPQENFGREIMELFTMGVGNYTESDVYAAARVFTGWNLQRPGQAANGTQHYEFVYRPEAHDTGSKTFSFPVYADGGKTIAARSSSSGMQDGLDLIAGLARNPSTGRYLATKLYRFFVSETGPVSERFVDNVSKAYQRSHYDMRAVMREVLWSQEFWDDKSYFARYSWPVEFVVRSIKEVGWAGFSVGGTTLTALTNMGQLLYDPPDVAGWDLGQSWFSTGAMLARMNFAATLASNQRFRLAPNTPQGQSPPAYASSPDATLSHVLELLSPAPFDSGVRADLRNYLLATGPWTGSDAQLQTKVPGLVHLVTGSSEYQLV